MNDIVQVLGHPVVDTQQFPKPGHTQRAEGCQAGVTRLFKNRAAQALFQFPDAQGQGRLGAVQQLRSPLETAVVDHRQNVAKLLEFEGHHNKFL